MDFSSPMFLIGAVISGIFLLTGFLKLRFPTPEINDLVGYRSKRARKSQRAWDFAQRFAGKQMLFTGLFIFLCSIPGLFLPFPENLQFAGGVAVVLLFAWYPVLRTERALSIRFATLRN